MSAEKYTDAMQEAYSYISTAKDNLESSNRFFTDEEFIGYLRKIFCEAETYIPSNKVFYRARRYDASKVDSSKIGTKFEGYGAKESFVNIDSKWPNVGRMNPEGISVLYVASDVRTAITELHPYYTEIYSVATVKANETLRIADLSRSESSINDDFTRNLAIYVQEWISQGSSNKDYVFPQYISSYCKSLGYDGIAYRSKYATRDNARNHEGINYTIFNFKKCEVISTKLYNVGKVSIQTSPYSEGISNSKVNAERQKRVLQFISDYGQVTLSQIASQSGIARASAEKYVQMLINDGKIVVATDSTGKKYSAK